MGDIDFSTSLLEDKLRSAGIKEDRILIIADIMKEQDVSIL